MQIGERRKNVRTSQGLSLDQLVETMTEQEHSFAYLICQRMWNKLLKVFAGSTLEIGDVYADW